jgi:hypothetical protein
MLTRICERCRRTFECVAISTVRLCKVCAIVFVGIAAPHDLPHNHNDPSPPPIHLRSTVATSTSSASAIGTAIAPIIWRDVKLQDNSS